MYQKRLMLSWFVTLLIIGVFVFSTGSSNVAATGGQPQPTVAPRAVLDQYCVTCHNQKTKTAGLALDTVDVARVARDTEVWEKVLRKLRARLMPPAGRPRPDSHSYDSVATWLETELDREAAANPNPGRTDTFHRLNRLEYQNAVRDLLEVDVDVTALLPADDASYGFDNIAGVLRIDESRMERYLSAAAKISRAAVGVAPPAPSTASFFLSPELPQYDHVEGLPFGTRGGTLIQHHFPQDAEYVIKAQLRCAVEADLKCDAAGGYTEPHQLEITIDGERVGLFTLESRPMHRGYYDAWDDLLKVRVPVKAGPREIGVAFLKTVPSIEYVRPGLRKRFQKPFRYQADVQRVWAPFVDNVSISGPFDALGAGDTPSRRRLFVCAPANAAAEGPCAEKIISTLARRAYRRPVADTEVQTLMTFYKARRAEASFDEGIEAALRRLLVSPAFLYRIERDPGSAGPNANYRISNFELASRLSFFLWSSIPDDELLSEAASGRLFEPAVLDRQVRRMLADRRSRALVNSFFAQWLQVRNLEAAQPSAILYPDFDEGLRQALRVETDLFIDHIIREDRSVLDILNADYTFVNERLALHYGIPNVKGSHFRRVTLSDENRRGLLGHGSVLTVTSRPNRTSPVLRGKWLLETILGTPPSPPPPNVPALPEKKSGADQKVLSIRDRMAAHRANAVCAGCHAPMDPLGFALEHFDAIGRWRDVDEAFQSIDASGALADSTKFDGVVGLRRALMAQPDRFVMTLMEKLLTYALGRGVEPYDMPTLRRIVRDAGRTEYRFSSLILGIAKSLPFQMRRSVR